MLFIIKEDVELCIESEQSQEPDTPHIGVPGFCNKYFRERRWWEWIKRIM